MLLRFIIKFFLIAVIMAFNQVYAQNNPSENIAAVIGTSTIYNKNTANARDNAIESGMSLAVEQTALKLFPLDIIAQNFPSLNSILQKPAKNFIENYKIMAEYSSNKKYHILLQVAVSNDLLKKELSDFKSVYSKKKKKIQPKILFLIAEQNLNNISPVYWWGKNNKDLKAYAENAIADKIKATGFLVIDHGNTPPDVEVVAAIIFQPELDNHEAVNIGKNLQADIVIAGKSIVYKVPDTQDNQIQSFSATLTARAVRVENRQEIASILKTSITKNADEVQGSKEALRAAGSLAGEELASHIARLWQDVLEADEMMQLVVSGTSTLGNFIRFRKMLNNMESVISIQIKEMKKDEALISLMFQGTVQELAEELKKQEFKLFDIKINSISEKIINIALVSK